MTGFLPIIVRATGKLVAPLIVLFAAYLAANGLDGDGGGLAAGLAFALAMALYALVIGVDAARSACPAWFLRALMGLGVLALIGLGAAGAARGYNFFDYQALLARTGPPTQRLGVAVVEAAMTSVSAGAFTLAFFAIAGRAGDMKEESW